MILLLYNIIQILLLLLLSPLLGVIICCTPKYRGRVGRRLGLGLWRIVIPKGRKIIWVHALSVGEVASSRPLLEALREKNPEFCLVLSSTTRGGEKFAESMTDIVDLFVPFPFDIFFVVRKFLRHIRPDIFILIETDFWPNFLHEIQKKEVASILANGRITSESMLGYLRFAFFFKRLFKVFDVVAMQTEQDAASMVELGVEPARVRSFGNLKYDTIVKQPDKKQNHFRLPLDHQVIVAGSTHPGEEEIVVTVFTKLLDRNPDLFLVIAPRDVTRGEGILDLAYQHGLKGSLRTASSADSLKGSLLVLDTLGELSQVYGMAQIVFVGGSLLDFGGHNPLEAALHGKPVLYGPYMNDFSEISNDLLAAEAAISVEGEEELFTTLASLLHDVDRAKLMGDKGARLVREKGGAASRYAEMIGALLAEEKMAHEK